MGTAQAPVHDESDDPLFASRDSHRQGRGIRRAERRERRNRFPATSARRRCPTGSRPRPHCVHNETQDCQLAADASRASGKHFSCPRRCVERSVEARPGENALRPAVAPSAITACRAAVYTSNSRGSAQQVGRIFIRVFFSSCHPPALRIGFPGRGVEAQVEIRVSAAVGPPSGSAHYWCCFEVLVQASWLAGFFARSYGSLRGQSKSGSFQAFEEIYRAVQRRGTASKGVF